MKNIGFFLGVLLIISLFSRLVSFAFAQNDYPTGDFKMQLELNKTSTEKLRLQAEEDALKTVELNLLKDKLTQSNQELQAKEQAQKQLETRDKLTQPPAEKEQAPKRLETSAYHFDFRDVDLEVRASA